MLIAMVTWSTAMQNSLLLIISRFSLTHLHTATTQLLCPHPTLPFIFIITQTRIYCLSIYITVAVIINTQLLSWWWNWHSLTCAFFTLAMTCCTSTAESETHQRQPPPPPWTHHCQLYWRLKPNVSNTVSSVFHAWIKMSSTSNMRTRTQSTLASL